MGQEKIIDDKFIISSLMIPPPTWFSELNISDNAKILGTVLFEYKLLLVIGTSDVCLQEAEAWL